MISYGPLMETLRKKGGDIYWLQDKLNNRTLRATINASRYIGLRTIDSICELLGCRVQDVIEFKSGEQVILERKKAEYREVDWAKVREIVLKRHRDYKSASLFYGRSPGYLSSLSRHPRLKVRTIRWLCEKLICRYEDIKPDEKK